RRGAPVYLQRFVPNPGRDIRVMVVGGEAIGATYRLARRGRWKTNITAGGIPAPCPVTPELAAIALAATASVGLDIAGVDVIEGPQGYQILEINAWPNYERFDQVAGVDVADRIAQLLIARAQKAAADQAEAEAAAADGGAVARQRLNGLGSCGPRTRCGSSWGTCPRAAPARPRSRGPPSAPGPGRGFRDGKRRTR